jgi:hypothetical protein
LFDPFGDLSQVALNSPLQEHGAEYGQGKAGADRHRDQQRCEGLHSEFPVLGDYGVDQKSRVFLREGHGRTVYQTSFIAAAYVESGSGFEGAADFREAFQIAASGTEIVGSVIAQAVRGTAGFYLPGGKKVPDVVGVGKQGVAPVFRNSVDETGDR